MTDPKTDQEQTFDNVKLEAVIPTIDRLHVTKELFKILILGAHLLLAILLIGELIIWQPTIMAMIVGTLDEIHQASRSGAKASKSVERSAQAQEKLLTDPKTLTAIGVLTRKADNISRMIDHVNDLTIPKVDKLLDSGKGTLDQGSRTLAAGEHILITTDGQIAGIGTKAQQDLDSIKTLLEDENLKEIAKSLKSTIDQSKTDLASIDLTINDLRSAIPETKKLILAILENTKNGTLHTSEVAEDLHTFMAGVNTPLTKKQKAIKYILQVLAIGLPVALKR